MKFPILSRPKLPPELRYSRLFNEDTFYDAFVKDLNNCLNEAIIESPFVTHRRLIIILPVLEKLKKRGVRLTINTRDPRECEENYWRHEAMDAIATLQHAGIHVIYTVGHHRKLAIVDRNILWEGSLNILSQSKSSEVMRRIESPELAWQMAHFTKLDARSR